MPSRPAKRLLNTGDTSGMAGVEANIGNAGKAQSRFADSSGDGGRWILVARLEDFHVVCAESESALSGETTESDAEVAIVVVCIRSQ